MPVYAEMSGNLKAIEFQTNIAVEQAVAATAEQFISILKEEIPWERIKDDVQVEYNVETKGKTTAVITIGANSGANEYIWELWKGNPNDRTHTAQGKAMRFSNWDKGPDEFRASDGFFYFKRVNHPPIEGNDFIGRAIARLRVIVKSTFGQRVANYFKNIRRK
mgnify:CR=1 FL=1